MKNISLSILTFFIVGNSLAQGDTIPNNWRLKVSYGLNGAQASFVNWNTGGRNSISLLGYADASANYIKGIFKWDNNLGLALGGVKYISEVSMNPLQKTDDKIDLTSNFGFKINRHWYGAILGNFKTQFMEGNSFSNDSIVTSKFMAPGYSTFAVGVDYKPTTYVSIYSSPIASKITLVNDEALSNAGAFGVEGATYDALGNVITTGKRFRGEFGAYFKLMYNKEIVRNINMKSKLELFCNYMNNPGNIDIAAEIIFNFKVNTWFSASLNLNLLYDDDIEVIDINGDIGPRTQFKSLLGLGVSSTLRNFKEK